MSWAEIKKAVNDDISEPLNKQISRLLATYNAHNNAIIYAQTILHMVTPESVAWAVYMSDYQEIAGLVFDFVTIANNAQLRTMKTMTEIAASPVAIPILLASRTAMTAVAASPVALAAFANSSIAMNLVIAHANRDIFFINGVASVGTAIYTAAAGEIASNQQAGFASRATLRDVLSNSTQAQHTYGSDRIFKALLLSPRTLNWLAKNGSADSPILYNNQIAASAHNATNFTAILALCRANPALFARAPVAGFAPNTSERYHNIQTNTWTSTRVAQAALYFWHRYTAATASPRTINAYNFTESPGGGTALITGQGSGENLPLGKFQLGYPGAMNAATSAAWTTANNNDGEAFIPI